MSDTAANNQLNLENTSVSLSMVPFQQHHPDTVRNNEAVYRSPSKAHTASNTGFSLSKTVAYRCYDLAGQSQTSFEGTHGILFGKSLEMLQPTFSDFTHRGASERAEKTMEPLC